MPKIGRGKGKLKLHSDAHGLRAPLAGKGGKKKGGRKKVY